MRFISKGASIALIAAACSLGAVATASASGSEFVFSKAGTLKGASTTEQAFTTAAGKFTCADVASGSVSKTSSTTLKTTVQYESCKFFGLYLKFSPAEYEYNTNGTVKILKEVTGKATACEIKIPAQTLTGISYANTTGKLDITAGTTGITSEGTGTYCKYASESKGTLSGSSLVELLDGTISIN